MLVPPHLVYLWDRDGAPPGTKNKWRLATSYELVPSDIVSVVTSHTTLEL